jgi:polyhydroxyalkanoate synthesis regulator phasin
MAQISNHINPTLVGNLSNKDNKQAKQLANILEQLISLRRQSEAKETALKVQLKNILKPAYFDYNQVPVVGSEVEHTFDLENLQVNFTSQYYIKDSAHLQTIAKLLGADHPLAQHVKEVTKITVDVTDLTPEEANELAAKLATASANYEIIPQVERKPGVTQEFHDERHVYLTTEDNLALDEVLPLVIQVTPIE